MISPALERIVHTILYEGYILYPYRPTSIKNQRERFTFGRVYPKDYSDAQKGGEPCLIQTECLLQIRRPTAALEVTVRFLHPMSRETGQITNVEELAFRATSARPDGGEPGDAWQEATEREVNISISLSDPNRPSQVRLPFSFCASRVLEIVSEQTALQRWQDSLSGWLEIETSPLGRHLFKASVRVFNHTPMKPGECESSPKVLRRTFASTHTILQANGAEFVSMMDPPATLCEFAGQCKNVGTWPVLVGDEARGERNTMLSSPILLYDYPQIAPERPGPFFDGTQIDPMLTLRVLSKKDNEKLEMQGADDQSRRLLDRTERTPGRDFLAFHGTRPDDPTHEFLNPARRLSSVFSCGQELQAGSSVRIHPKKRADASDKMVEGRTAKIEAIEQDAKGQVHLALVIEDDSGKNPGMARQPRPRFFYDLDEVEPLKEAI